MTAETTDITRKKRRGDDAESTETATATKSSSSQAESSAGRYDALIRSLADRLSEPASFRYDVGCDPLYRQYAERYLSNARRASDDTLADAASYTGGYGNSYAVSAANQAYGNALSGLNDIVPELYQLAYDASRDQRADIQSAFNAYSALDERDYNRYRDTLADEKTARDEAYERERDALAQENFLKELYAKYPTANPDYVAPSSGKKPPVTTNATSADNCERFLKSLTSSQRQAVYNGTDATNTRYREEIIASVGQDGYEKLKQKYA